MRQITSALRGVINSRRRYPAYKVYAWNPSELTISQIVSSLGNPSASALDLTPYVSDVTWSDKQFSFTMVDPRGLFHPDTGGFRNYLCDGAILRLVEGDETIPESDWVVTFTGQIRGQVGWKMARHSGEISSKVTVFGRGETQAYKRRKITSPEYTVGTDLGIALYDICNTFMGMTPIEMRIPFVLGRQFRHLTNQLSQVSPWDGISSLLEVACYLPCFDGEGKLTYINKNMNRPPDKMLADYVSCVELEVPENSQDGINKIRVVFLDAALSRVNSAPQKLGTAQVTTGFFSKKETLHCWWSEDRKQRAFLTYMLTLKSCNTGLIKFCTERYSQIDDYHGDVTVTVSVWVAILATVMVIAYIAAAFIPNWTIGAVSVGVAGGIGVSAVTVFQVPGTGWTINIGGIVQSILLAGLLVIMMSLGSGQYEILGTPFDYAFLEKTSIAQEDGLDYWMENEKEIKNDFIGTHDQADTIALTELIWEKCLTRPRRMIIEDDQSLEVGDIIGIPDGRKMLIAGLSKRIQRGEVPSLVIDGYKVMTA